ncbi:hypothetical protein SAMN05444955_12147 [Lihuaxuella thermophila]|uniref:Uncharacterized protein n=1 Tax=Lihuaxuella thermophila TaxID=1173111 RepID=A0A1H8J3J7_9BACL|nr:hypothetical protein SAMN05444955_12147 [Lihuaxuella thermophila]
MGAGFSLSTKSVFFFLQTVKTNRNQHLSKYDSEKVNLKVYQKEKVNEKVYLNKNKDEKGQENKAKHIS